MFRKILISVFLIFCFLPVGNARATGSAFEAGIVTTSGGNLNIRSTPSTGSSLAGTLPNGSYVTLISKSGNWWKVEYSSGRFGYCHADYIRKVPSSNASVTATSLNVRSSPSTAHRIDGYLHKGDSVLVLSTANGWSRILYRGTKLGYVSAKYLSEAYPSVSLSVPSFKQMDDRWSDVPIGSSGKTFAQIGCATTAIAMLESHRTGKTVYPHEMTQSLRYTASGSVYWPSHYTVVTNPAGYLSGIYARLRQGKPVLLGVKNSYGTQHWVVITGFAGSTLSPGNFTVQDPGSAYRTNLQQLLDSYPNFYKYFHY